MCMLNGEKPLWLEHCVSPLTLVAPRDAAAQDANTRRQKLLLKAAGSLGAINMCSNQRLQTAKERDLHCTPFTHTKPQAKGGGGHKPSARYQQPPPPSCRGRWTHRLEHV